MGSVWEAVVDIDDFWHNQQDLGRFGPIFRSCQSSQLGHVCMDPGFCLPGQGIWSVRLIKMLYEHQPGLLLSLESEGEVDRFPAMLLPVVEQGLEGDLLSPRYDPPTVGLYQ